MSSSGLSGSAVGGRLAIGVIASLVLSVLPGLAIMPIAAAEVPGELSLQASDDSEVTIEPRVVASGTIGQEVTVTVAPGPWPEEFGLELYSDATFSDNSGALEVSSVDGAQATVVFTEQLPDGLYTLYAQALPGGLGGRMLGAVSFIIGEGAVYQVAGTVTDTADVAIEGMCVGLSASRASGGDGPDFAFDTAQTRPDGTYTSTMLVAGESSSTRSAGLSIRDCRRPLDEAYAPAVGDERLSVSLSRDAVYQQDWIVYRAATIDVTVQDETGAVLDCGALRGPLGPGEHTVLIPGCANDGTVYADVWVGNTRNPDEAEVIAVAEGDRLSRTVTVQPAGVVSGSITEAATGQGADSCVQVFERVDGVRTYASQRVFPSSTMEYELRVGPGAPVLEFNQCESTDSFGSVNVQPFPYRAQFFDKADSLDAADPVSIDAGATVTGIDAALVAGDGFSDVSSDHPFVTEIGWMVGAGLTQGFPDGTFRPTVAVSRQAAAAFLYRLAGEPAVTSEAGFSDVPSGHPFHDEIAWLVEEGITEGFSDGEFRPTRAVSRQAAAAFLYRYDGEPAVAGVAGFPDVPEDHPFHDEIAWMVGESITTGFPNGGFRPVDDVTRQAMAAFLYRYETG